ncbi:MAG: 30S ribosomal protein S5 [bacterium]
MRPTNNNPRTQESNPSDLIERMISLDRVTRVVKGGRRFRFRATVVVGDGHGTVGVGVGKGRDVVSAIQKAAAVGKKDMVTLQLNGTTINHEINAKFGGAKVFMKPAPEGTGVIAGGAVRSVLEVAGVRDVFTKALGSTNKINNAHATIVALKALKTDPAPEKSTPSSDEVKATAKLEEVTK